MLEVTLTSINAARCGGNLEWQVGCNKREREDETYSPGVLARLVVSRGEGRDNDHASFWICLDGSGFGSGRRERMRHKELRTDTDTAPGGTHRQSGQEDRCQQCADSGRGQRAQAGISRAQGAADTATQNAQSASQSANDARRQPTTPSIAPIHWIAW